MSKGKWQKHPKHINLTVRLSEQDAAILTALAAHWKTKRAATIRRAASLAFMEVTKNDNKMQP